MPANYSLLNIISEVSSIFFFFNRYWTDITTILNCPYLCTVIFFVTFKKFHCKILVKKKKVKQKTQRDSSSVYTYIYIHVHVCRGTRWRVSKIPETGAVCDPTGKEVLYRTFHVETVALGVPKV